MGKAEHGNLHLDTYIRKVLKQIHPAIGLDANALSVVNQLVTFVLGRIACVVSSLHSAVHHETITAREIETAVRIAFPVELGKHAVAAASNAATRYAMDATDGKKVMAQTRAGLQFPVTRIGRFMMAHVPFTRKSASAAVYLAAVAEYISAEILRLAGNAARDTKRQRITPRMIYMATAYDVELSGLFGGVIQFGGVLPNIHEALLHGKTSKKSKKRAE